MTVCDNNAKDVYSDAEKGRLPPAQEGINGLVPQELGNQASLRRLVLYMMWFAAAVLLALRLSASSLGLLLPSKPISGIPQATYDDLVRYTKYSSGAYQLLCVRPLGNILVESVIFSRASSTVLRGLRKCLTSFLVFSPVLKVMWLGTTPGRRSLLLSVVLGIMWVFSLVHSYDVSCQYERHLNFNFRSGNCSGSTPITRHQ